MASKCIRQLNIHDFLVNTLPITIMELLAALAGSFFLFKTATTKINNHLVLFLWITFIVEVSGAYAPIAFFSDYEFFPSIERSVLWKNNWLYNCYSLYFYAFLSYYFIRHLQNRKSILIMKTGLATFVIVAIINLIFSGKFFEEELQFTLLFGTLLLVASIIVFYFELLQSDLILQLKKFLPMYISAGVLIFSLCVTTVDIFSEYFSSENTVFVSLRTNVFLYTNIFMYSIFSIGFIICSRKTYY